MNHERAAIRNQHIRLWWEAAEPVVDIAEHFNLHPFYLLILAKKFDWLMPERPKVKRGRKPKIEPPKIPKDVSSRTLRFIEMFRHGKTLQEIGDVYGVTRERVRQVLAAHGLTKDDGGLNMRIFSESLIRIEKIKAQREKTAARHFRLYGCSEEYILSISPLKRTDKKHPIFAYRYQKNNAKIRELCR